MDRNLHHGFDPAKWEAAKREARAIIYGVARRRGTISYSDLVGQISSVRMEPHDPRLGQFLGEISGEDDEADLGLSTVLVVHKSGDGQPGPGFYDLAQSRGRDVSDPVALWCEELTRVHDAWADR